MAQKLSEETEVKLDLKTIGIIVGGAISLASMYFALKSDIAMAKELPEPEVSKIEWSYKDELVRSEISNTNEKVEGLEKSVGEIKEQLNKIDERLYQISKNR
jgi:septal ring factor EnvC (AmiA/AmiB activator)